jgi:hypothetical protein
MADDTFRQERKKTHIDPSEIEQKRDTVADPSDDAAEQKTENVASLDAVLKMQKQAGVDVPVEDPEKLAVSTEAGVVQPRPMDGIKVSGQMPPAMQQALQRRLQEVEFQEDGGQVQHRGEQPVQLPPHQRTDNTMRAGQIQTNDPSLNALLGMVHTQNYETVTLPSMGRFYFDGIDTPTTGEVNIRPMTGREESILSTARFMRQGRGIEMIFQNCLLEKNINTEKLLSVDRTFLLIYLRGISYGNIYEAKVKCPECGHTFDNDIDLNLPIDYCPRTSASKT